MPEEIPATLLGVALLETLGGALIGVLTLIASLFGILGGVGGTGMLLTVSILHQMYEQLAREQMMEMHPIMRRFLGGA